MKKLALLVVYLVSWKVIGTQFKNFDPSKSVDIQRNACEVVAREGAHQYKTLEEAKRGAEEIKASGQAIDIKIWKMDEAR